MLNCSTTSLLQKQRSWGSSNPHMGWASPTPPHLFTAYKNCVLTKKPTNF